MNIYLFKAIMQLAIKIMHNSNSEQALMIFMIYTMRLVMVFLGEAFRVRFDRGSVLSLALACLSLNFCPTFPFLSPLLKTV